MLPVPSVRLSCTFQLWVSPFPPCTLYRSAYQNVILILTSALSLGASFVLGAWFAAQGVGHSHVMGCASWPIIWPLPFVLGRKDRCPALSRCLSWDMASSWTFCSCVGDDPCPVGATAICWFGPDEATVQQIEVVGRCVHAVLSQLRASGTGVDEHQGFFLA